MKQIYNWIKVASPITSMVSLAGCVVLSIVCFSTNQKLKHAENTIENYASKPLFKTDDKEFTLLDILNQHKQQINDLYNGQRRIWNNQSNIQQDLDRSNRFLHDYNTSRVFDDDWPMKRHY